MPEKMPFAFDKVYPTDTIQVCQKTKNTIFLKILFEITFENKGNNL